MSGFTSAKICVIVVADLRDHPWKLKVNKHENSSKHLSRPCCTIITFHSHVSNVLKIDPCVYFRYFSKNTGEIQFYNAYSFTFCVFFKLLNSFKITKITEKN